LTGIAGILLYLRIYAVEENTEQGYNNNVICNKFHKRITEKQVKKSNINMANYLIIQNSEKSERAYS
jgi:hypothetical protein